ncbi:two-component system histidine kinase PnpS [Pullulanibacillus camelliae]|nr:ATP-binding protein [Pullulanibacillus camelliae]
MSLKQWLGLPMLGTVFGCLFLFWLIIGALVGHWLSLTLIFVLLFFCTIAIFYYFFRTMLTVTDEALTTIKRFTEGSFNLSASDRWNRSANPLNDEIYRLSSFLLNMRRSFQNQQDQLSALIENIGSPFLFIDSHGRIRLANELFQQIFDNKIDSHGDLKYDQVIKNKAIIAMIARTFQIKTDVHDTLVVPVGIERKHFDVHSIPIRRGHGHSKGLVVIFHDITRLKKLEKVRKDFVANVSHELRTPVTSLKGFAETLLEDSQISDEDREKFLTIILKESDRLQLLIQDLLELSKIEDEHFQLNKEAVDVARIAQETIELLKETARKKEISVQFNTSGTTVASGDSARLKQMFVNIINNAIAYSPEKSHISVEVAEEGNAVIFRTTDTGIGIVKEEIPRIFERFYRVDRARSRNSGGTGLGLAIVKHLTEAHNGRIEVESEQGVGTTFSIYLNKYVQKE